MSNYYMSVLGLGGLPENQTYDYLNRVEGQSSYKPGSWDLGSRTNFGRNMDIFKSTCLFHFSVKDKIVYVLHTNTG